MTTPSACDICSDDYEFFAGESKPLYIHLDKRNPANSLLEPFDLTPYTVIQNGTIKLQIPGIAALQDAAPTGNPKDGNIVFQFTSTLTEMATTGTIMGWLTDALSNRLGFRTGTKIKKMG
jgi:hypothetical protein